MTISTFDKRLKESREARKSFWNGFTLERFGTFTSLMALVVFFSGISIVYNRVPSLQTLASDFYANISSELASIVITVLIVDRLSQEREKRDQEALQKQLDEQELTRLIALLKSNEPVVTKIAIAELSAKNWHRNGLLRRIDLRKCSLSGANLSGAKIQRANFNNGDLVGVNLKRANLQWTSFVSCKLQKADLRGIILEEANLLSANLAYADLHRAKLQNAQLKEAILQNTRLRDANLQGANLYKASLHNSSMYKANLRGADLRRAELQGVDLYRADLQHANVRNVVCNEKTILPDGTAWTPDVDWSEYGAVNFKSWLEWQAYLKENNLLG